VDHIMLPGLLALWVEQLAAPLHGRHSWRMARLVAGITLAQGRRTVTSWLRAAGIADGYRSYYYFLDALGHKAQAVGLILLRLCVTRVAIGDRLTLALDDTPTKRHGPKVQGAGRHYNPTPGPAGVRVLYGHSWVVLARLVGRRLCGTIGLPLWATLYVRRRDVPQIPARAGWSFRTKLELAAAMIDAAAGAVCGSWSGAVWLLTDGGYARRPIFRAARAAGWCVVGRLRRDAHLNDLPPTVRPGQRRRPGRPRTYGANRLSLAKRAGQGRGWAAATVRASTGEVQTWAIKSFLATWRPAGGAVRVLIVRDESGWRAYACTDPGASPQAVAQAVADRWGIEQVFHDVKENERIGQVQLRRVWSNVGAFNLGLWVNSLVELWAWRRGEGSLVDRRSSPWDTPLRRPSHGDRRKALQRELMEERFRRCGARGRGVRKLRDLFRAVVKLVA
jgi:hypothetical protein